MGAGGLREVGAPQTPARDREPSRANELVSAIWSSTISPDKKIEALASLLDGATGSGSGGGAQPPAKNYTNWAVILLLCVGLLPEAKGLLAPEPPPETLGAADIAALTLSLSELRTEIRSDRESRAESDFFFSEAIKDLEKAALPGSDLSSINYLDRLDRKRSLK